MTSNETTRVVIVGAGPTGLTLACDLARRGIDIRVVDKASEYFTGSRGKTLSPRALEVLDDLGVAPQILAAGIRDLPMRTYDADRVISETLANPTVAGSPAVPYSSAVFIPQWRTEGILRDQLACHGVTVELDREVTAIDQDEDNVTVTVSSPGTTSRIQADYVVGCDGAHSTTRRLIGLSFHGSVDETAKYSQVGDVRIEGLAPNVAHRWNDPRRGMLLLSPFKDTDLWQFQVLPADGAPKLPEPSLETFRRVFDEWAGLPGVRLLDARTASKFRINEHIADHYRAGRVFLAGDAAHVYSPAGGQGMTTGIQDAYNLGWKLAAALAGVPTDLLDTYEAERRPVAQHAMDRSGQRWRQINEAVAAKTDSQLWELVINDDTSQLNVNYRGGPLAPVGAGATTTLHAGDRAPDGLCRNVDTGQPVRLFDLFRGPHWTVLNFGDRPQTTAPCRYYGATVRSFPIDGHPLRDETGGVHATYGITGDTQVVVRPDGYIARITTADTTIGL
jgi:2-polyprenyl-6-methoxyphenol hydroxylase-like FAD-dependent oxidoreductase